MKLGPATPIFRMFDEDRARDFYVRWIGCSVLFEHRFGPDMPLYLGLQRDGFILHLSGHSGDTTPGTRIRVVCDNITGLYDDLQSRPESSLRLGPPQMQSWGDIELALTDPFGNRITFYEEGT
ncbi:glyoxalase superfamily protein [Roseobacter sp. CCS2]|uniref:glyoxalase superfamily protein n=1 Tax=Roseobacter sp. CCS2 TaxID=391593 RepID=UPI000314DCF5|nr:glyoxalase superfamily protein [Roseobacter sp. CCS2]